jgi:cystathionine beta-lyase
VGSEFGDLDLARLYERHSMKWRWFPRDVLPAWVAEMDFPVAPPIEAAVAASLGRGGDFGYAVDLVAPDLAAAFSSFAARRYSWAVDPEHTYLVRDVMRGVELWIEGFTAPGDGVVVTSPVYHPFGEATREAARRLVEVPVARSDGGWVLDLDGLAAAFRAGNRLLLLCNPHNPVGRAYTERELRALAELVDRYDVRVVADEIHAPLVLPPGRHIPFASLDPAIAARTLSLHSASKAWNLAGLHAAVAVPGSPADEAYLTGLSYRHRGAAAILGIDASVAAFAHGEPWLDALLAHLVSVRGHLDVLLAKRLPGVAWVPPEATYLAWLDCRGLGLGPNPAQAFLDRGRVGVNDGATFGTGGEGHVRLNFGTSHAIVTEIVTRLAAALP